MSAGIPIYHQNNLPENFCFSLLGHNYSMTTLAVVQDEKVVNSSYSCSEKWQGRRGLGMAAGFTN